MTKVQGTIFVRPLKCKVCTKSKIYHYLAFTQIMMVTPVKSHQNLGNGREGLQDKALGTGVSTKNAHILDVKLQVRLTLHIQQYGQYHKDITAERRWKMTKAAKVVGQVKCQPAYSLSQGMKKIEILFQKETARQQ